MVLLGGFLQTVALLGPWPFRRANGERGQVGNSLRGIGYAARAGRWDVVAPMHATRLLAVTDRLGDDPRAAAAWIMEIASAAEAVRLDLFAITAYRHERQDSATALALDAVISAAGTVCIDAARTLTWHRRRHALTVAVARVQTAATAVRAHGDPTATVLATALAEAVQRLAAPIVSSWPLGWPTPSTRPRGVRRQTSPSWWSSLDLASHLRWTDPYVRHAVRVTVAMVVGTVIATLLGRPDGFWIPVTVAWISKLDEGSTYLRIVSRILGTVVGAGIVAITLTLVPDATLLIVLLVGTATVVAHAFLVPNYTVAVAGFTSFILFIFALARESGWETWSLRVADTVLACLIVVLIGLLLPTRSGETIGSTLAGYARVLAAYVRHADASTSKEWDRAWVDRRAVISARARAVACVGTARFERGGHRLDLDNDASILIHQLDLAIGWCRAHNWPGSVPDDRDLVGPTATRAEHLADRIDALHAGRADLPHRGATPDHPVAQHLEVAHGVLDDAFARASISTQS